MLMKPIDNLIKEVPRSGINNGGATGYYDLPPESERPCIDDLIEHKEMQRWRSEVFKSMYGLDGRATRSTDGSSSEARELNKCFYYLNRRMRMLGLPLYVQETTKLEIHLNTQEKNQC